MKSNWIGIFLIFILLFLCTASITTAQEDLQITLSNVYKAFLAAAHSGDIVAIEKNMASNSFITSKNQTVSAKREFNGKMFKKMSEFMPDITRFEFFKTVEKGDTAVLIYIKGSGAEKETAILKFVNEESKWKFDSVSSHYGDKDLSDDDAIIKEYEINGIVKKAPPVYPEPDYAGLINANSYGYRMVIIINDIKQVDLEDKSSGGIILGGLKKGENKVDIEIVKIDKDTMFKPEFSILQIPGPGQRGKEIYKFKPEEEVKNNYSETIIVE